MAHIRHRNHWGRCVLGLAHAWAAAERGERVVLFERSNRAQGASVRNFGMIWPIGQPAGHALELAHAQPCKMVACRHPKQPSRYENPAPFFLATREDEAAVMREFCEAAPQMGYRCRIVEGDELFEALPCSPPRHRHLWRCTVRLNLPSTRGERSQTLPTLLLHRLGVELRYGTAVTHAVQSGRTDDLLR